MFNGKDSNLDLLQVAVEYLGELADDMVFIGGCATGLLLTDLAAPPIRATRDVDVITEVTTLVAYHRLSEELRALGFKEDQSDDAPICRWVKDSVILDVMPTEKQVLGFGNDWYQPALETAQTMVLPSGKSIRLITAPYFLATKFAAFDGRGVGDYMMSHDMEDIIALLDGRPGIIEDVLAADEMVRKYLGARFASLLNNERFLEAIPGHLPGDMASQARVPTVLERIARMVQDK